MLATPADLARTYDAYHAYKSPANAVHTALDASALLTRAQAAATNATQARELGGGAAGTGRRAHAGGLYLASAVSFVLKPLDVLVGTGCNFSGAQAPLATAGLGPHLTAAAKRPCQTGVLGLLNGLSAAACAAVGAAAGAAVGLVGGSLYLALARDPARSFGAQLGQCVSGCAADGALVVGTGLALWAGLLGSLLLVGTLRLGTAAVRGALVGAAYVAGYALGLLGSAVLLGTGTLHAETRPVGAPAA